MKNIFAAVKKSVTPTKKDKYSSNEPNESELKVAVSYRLEKVIGSFLRAVVANKLSI